MLGIINSDVANRVKKRGIRKIMIMTTVLFLDIAVEYSSPVGIVIENNIGCTELKKNH